MKRKGISFWEQHLERIVLAVAALFFVGFTGWQVLSEPNAVDSREDGTIAPADVDDLLRASASRLQSGLAPEAPAPLELPDPAPVVASFEEALARSITPAPMIAVSAPRVVIAKELETQVGVAFVEPKLPAPHTIVMKQDFAELTPEVVSNVPELSDRFKERPYDLTWVTAAALFDLGAVRDQFDKTGPNGEAAIPASWYRNRVDVLDVLVEREERVNGQWTNLVRLDPLPGMLSFRSRLGGDVDKSVRDQILSEIADPGVQDGIVRPEFYPTRNDAFTPPDPRLGPEVDEKLLTPEERELNGWIRRVGQWTSERDRLIERLTALGGTLGEGEGEPEEEEPQEEERDRGSGAGSGGGGGSTPPSGDRRERPKEGRKPPGAGAGTGPGLGTGGGGDTRQSDNQKRQIENLKKRIASLNRRILDYTRRIEARGAKTANADSGRADEIVVWVHDITVEPGKEYRYRFAVDLYNPFYAKKLNLLPEQHDLADSITMRSETSDWSRAREIRPDRQVFVTRAYGPTARNPGELRLGYVTAEVYRFSHGRWWLERFTVQPGDQIGWPKSTGSGGESAPAEINYGTQWVLLDVVDDIRADAQRREGGLGAQALLMSLSDDGLTQLADPVQAADDAVRLQLKEEVDLANLPEELASAGP